MNAFPFEKRFFMQKIWRCELLLYFCNHNKQGNIFGLLGKRSGSSAG